MVVLVVMCTQNDAYSLGRTHQDRDMRIVEFLVFLDPENAISVAEIRWHKQPKFRVLPDRLLRA
jgi:hypothetical protein